MIMAVERDVKPQLWPLVDTRECSGIMIYSDKTVDVSI